MARGYDNCTEVTPECPVSGTTYGYAPNVAANVIFLAIFAILFLLHIPFAFRYRLWTYSVFVGAGCLMEAIGYVGRILLHSNPWASGAFTMQVTCLIIAPSLIAAGIYLTVKHVMLHFGAEYSRLQPKLYTWIFVGCDVFSILIQAAGGGIAASADESNPNQAKVGNDVIIVGIVFQVVTMVLCGVLVIDYTVRFRKSKRTNTNEGQTTLLQRPRIFCVTSVLAYLFVLIRCIYRAIEMGGGWGNDLMRNEAEFMVLDSLMVAIGSTLLTVSYPGYMFPGMMKDVKGAISESGSASQYEKDRQQA